MAFIIGLCGPSGSGKTTLANELAGQFDAEIISLDNYFLLDPPLKKYGDNGKNWELPENTNWEKIRRVASDIKQNKHLRGLEISWEPLTQVEVPIRKSDFYVFEGFLLLHDSELLKYLDLAVYIDISDEEGIKRRMAREGTENNKKWFETVTFPEYKDRREDFKQKADLVLDGTMNIETNMKILLDRIQLID